MRNLLLFFCAIFAQASAAQPWTAETSRASRVASISDGHSTLSVECSTSSARSMNTIKLILAGNAANGPVQITSKGEPITVVLEKGRMNADSETNRDVFDSIVSGLKAGSVVQIEDSDGQIVELPLKGSSRAIGACPLPIKSFDLDQCQSERAFGIVTDVSTYSLGDFCVDRASGSVKGPLTLAGLTLTKDNGVNFTFEDLSGGPRDQMEIAPVIVATHHNSDVDDQSPEINIYQGTKHLVGFLYDELAAPDALADTFYVHVGYDGPELDIAPLGFEGETVFSNGRANIDLADSADYGTTRNTKGALQLIVGSDGTVTGSGSIYSENIRSAGYSRNEWVTVDISIDEIRGFATGPTGQVIKSYALVTTEMTDAEGDVRRSKGFLEVFLYDPKIWE